MRSISRFFGAALCLRTRAELRSPVVKKPSPPTTAQNMRLRQSSTPISSGGGPAAAEKHWGIVRDSMEDDDDDGEVGTLYIAWMVDRSSSSNSPAAAPLSLFMKKTPHESIVLS